MVNSALYEGTLRHRRLGPRPHRFAYALTLLYLDLAELDEVFARHPLWSVERPNAVSFRRADFLGDAEVPLDTAVRDLVEARLGRRPSGAIRLLGHVRTWGWLFNPLTIYVCTDAGGDRIEALVLEVTNTPWHERHAYVLDGGAGEHRFAKALHVSPFFGMDQEYRLRMGEPGEHLVVELAALEGGEVVFEASLALRRRAITRSSLGRLLWRRPLLTLRVSTAIYTQALRLWAKRTPYHPHPARS
ncbi:MAG: DUF1365 domain-containing protein [Acidimicrobiales bacterium]